MGNANGSCIEEETDDLWWPKIEAKCEVNTESSVCRGGKSSKFSSGSDVDDTASQSELSVENKGKLDGFRLELARKHEKRRQIIADKRKEMDELKAEIARLKQENDTLKQHKSSDEKDFELERLRKDNEHLKEILQDKSRLLESSEELISKNRELRISIAGMQKELQELNTEVLNFEKERQEYSAHVSALKDVISVSKNMLEIREAQMKELKEKVESIEQSLAEREMNILSQDLRSEYERQLANIRSLRTLYQERSRIEKVEREQLAAQLEDVKKELQTEQSKNSELEERITELENCNSKKYDEIKALESNLGLTKAESRQFQSELAVINQLFSEIILGFNNSPSIDLDELRERLENHHDLLQEIVSNEISSEVSSALPKVLLDLLNDVNTKKEDETSDDKLEAAEAPEANEHEPGPQASTVNNRLNSVEEIAQNLPKVWRVLIELLSHQIAPVNELTDEDDTNNPCYKTVQTAKGPSLVLSVSQTFIRLKDLILEKKSLEKETNHLKQLNGHLENRLQDQEKRLELVHSELSKTWHVVGKLQKQHQLLHTQEKILRYELAQKRKLLGELKEELEYSREKWAQAREKNSCTERQWKELRTEFASRRKATFNDDINNSVESGYSDDRECSSDEEPGYETDVSECAQRNTEDVCDITENCDENDRGLRSEDNPVESLPNNDAIDAICDDPQISLVYGDSTEDQSIEESLEANIVSLDTLHPPQNAQQASILEDPEQRDISALLARRDERLRRLEGQADELVAQVSNTASRSVAISNRLDDLHEVYGNGREQGQATSIRNESTTNEDTSDTR